jgi:uncharacterized protein YutE (UPF0331/DUF86 family)
MIGESTIIRHLEQLRIYLDRLSLPTPDSGREAPQSLAAAGVIPLDLAVELQQAIGFRNIIVHQYMSIDYDLVFDALHDDLDQIEAFLRAISAFLHAQP